MIKIIKKGTLKRKVITYEVKCYNCGTIFQCEKEDVESFYTSTFGNSKAIMHCPICKERLDISLENHTKVMEV